MDIDRKFDLDWPHGHETLDGLPVRIICTDRVGEDQPLVGLMMREIERLNGSGEMIRYEAMGCWSLDGSWSVVSRNPSHNDLRNRAEPSV